MLIFRLGTHSFRNGILRTLETDYDHNHLKESVTNLE